MFNLGWQNILAGSRAYAQKKTDIFCVFPICRNSKGPVIDRTTSEETVLR